MPRVDCLMECPVYDSFRVQQVAGMFDVSLEAKSREQFSAEVPGIEEDWQIGVIVGPSGSGKSSIARQAFGGRLYAASEWPTDKAVVDCFGEQSVKDITAMLTAVGFSSPPAWVKPYHVLSNGQKFRCDLAKAMLSGGELIAFDEFTSVVDRTVAKIGSAAVAKAIRAGRACNRFVAVACHYDIIDWLEPDWVLDMASGHLARGRLWRRPPINLRIYASSHKHWRLFAKHHYLDSKEIPGAVCYVAEIDCVPACFVAVRHSAGHVGIKRISRIVTMPDFQGVGVGMACLKAVAEITLAKRGVDRITITSGHPAMMRGLERSKHWKLTAFNKNGSQFGKASSETRLIGRTKVALFHKSASRGRAVASFQFVPEPQKETYSREPEPAKLTEGKQAPMRNLLAIRETSPLADHAVETAAGNRPTALRKVKRRAAARPRNRRASPRRLAEAHGTVSGGSGLRLFLRRWQSARPTAGGRIGLSCRRLYRTG